MATPLRRSVTLAAAVATAAALGTGAVVLALPASAADAAPPTTLSDGTLDWGIKQSFRNYLAQPFAHGRTTLEGGARQAANNGVFTFVDGTGTYDTTTHATANSFKGGVRFEAHSGALDIRVSDVRLTTEGSAAPTGEILADVVTKEKDGSVSRRDDIAFAALDMSRVRPSQGAGGTMVFKDIPAKLTKDGAAAFAGFYKEGDELDAATLTVKAGARPTTAPPTTTPPTTQPPTTPPVTPTTTAPTTAAPTTTAPTSPAPTTTVPTTTAPTTTAPTTTAPTAPRPTDPAGAVGDGRLTWGVKQSWQRYVGEMCGGSVTASGGAVKRGSAYDFGFVKADLDADARKVEAAFSGRLAFVCAAHGIDWRVSDLKVRASGATGTLTADVTGATGTKDDVPLVDLDLSGADWTVDEGLVTLAGIPTKLTAAGSAAFAAPGGQGGYPAGTEMDPVTLTLAADEDASLPGTSGGSSTTGGASTTGGSGTAGGSSTTGGGGTVGGAGSVGGTGAGTVGGSGTAGGSGALAATGSGAPTGLLLAASGLLAAGGAAAVVAVRRRATES
ncbi:HtaA domain-containing protein [Streptomyces sp. NPDC015130]|uniref:HtaA domain-containing protein n=1 Tax=Streptomyces sp. NPDC015130 TaxID=3364940 RepID=UPI0037028DAC